MVYTIITALLLLLQCVTAYNPCNGNQHWVADRNGNDFCVDCEKCPPGEEHNHKCGAGERISESERVFCQPCEPGFFISSYDKFSCEPCDPPCVQGQEILEQCTPKKNVKCGKSCNDQNRYYDEKRGCLPCSYCGDGSGAAVEDECKRKLGATSNVICSFDRNVTRRSPATPSSEVQTTLSPEIVTAVIVSLVVFIGIILLTVFFLCRPCSIRRCRFLSKSRAAVNDQGIRRGNQLTLQNPANKEEIHVVQIKDSKPLNSLLEHEGVFTEICEALDTPMTPIDDIRAIAQHYGFNHYQIESRLKTSKEGPSRTLIKSLAATHPELKVQDFAAVIESKTKRKDIIKLLTEYDLDSKESL